MSLKAILAGFFTIVSLGITLQVMLIFVAVGYLELVKDYPMLSFLGDFSREFLILLSAMVLAIGGYVTAYIARRRVFRHAAIAGAMATGLSIMAAYISKGFNATGLLFVMLGILFALFGAYLWHRNHP